MSSESSKTRSTVEVAVGIAVTAALHLCFYFVVFLFCRIIIAILEMTQKTIPEDLFFSVVLVLFAGIGIVQFLYVAPSYFYIRRKGRADVARGLIIGAALTFLLNGGCWGWFLITKPRIGG